MSSLATAVSFDANAMWVDFADGRKLGVPLAYFPRLLNATDTGRLMGAPFPKGGQPNKLRFV